MSHHEDEKLNTGKLEEATPSLVGWLDHRDEAAVSPHPYLHSY